VQGVAMTRQPAARRRQTDARWLIDAGLLFIAVSNYWMSRMNSISVQTKSSASGRLGLFSTLIHACDTGWRSVDK
jgi:hypothetical protein